MEVFICHIKRYRVAKDLTQEALAERVGVRRETIMRLEKGKYNPSLKLTKSKSNALSLEDNPPQKTFIMTKKMVNGY